MRNVYPPLNDRRFQFDQDPPRWGFQVANVEPACDPTHGEGNWQELRHDR
jgi:hypothetical protein